MLSDNSIDFTGSIDDIVDHVMDTQTPLNPSMINVFSNLDKSDKTPTIKRTNGDMNSSSSSNDQSPKKLMKFAFNNSDTIDNKLDYLLEVVQKLDEENDMLKKKNDNLVITIKRHETGIRFLVKELNSCGNYMRDAKVEIDKINDALRVESEEKKHKTINDNMNIDDLKNKLYSEICVMHEKKVIEEPVVEKIINIINDNDIQKKKKENNVMIFGLKVTNDDIVTDKVNDLLQKIGVKKVMIKKVNKIIKKDMPNDVAPIIVELVNQSDRFVILKAAKTLAKINIDDETSINISLDLTEIERKRHKKLIMDRNMRNKQLKLARQSIAIIFPQIFK